ncbi:MAG TPA: hypothetical protein VNN18_05670 [Candidatus Xenobia bacterium]|nr:hypothetical protein [Candidatus Xenobia bacterium]
MSNIFWLSAHIDEIELSRKILHAFRVALAAPPPKIGRMKYGIDPVVWLYSLTTAYLNERYILQNLVARYLRELRLIASKTSGASPVASDMQSFLRKIDSLHREFFAEQRHLRNELIHERRLHSEQLWLLQAAYGCSKRERWEERWLLFEGERRRWIATVKRDNQTLKEALDTIAATTMSFAADAVLCRADGYALGARAVVRRPS